jgi:hypothetical protein
MEEFAGGLRVGYVFIVIGMLGLVLSLVMDTSVQTSFGNRVHNIGLLNEQLIWVIVSCFCLLIGIILIVSRKKKKAGPTLILPETNSIKKVITKTPEIYVIDRPTSYLAEKKNKTQGLKTQWNKPPKRRFSLKYRIASATGAIVFVFLVVYALTLSREKPVQFKPIATTTPINNTIRKRPVTTTTMTRTWPVAVPHPESKSRAIKKKDEIRDAISRLRKDMSESEVKSIVGMPIANKLLLSRTGNIEVMEKQWVYDEFIVSFVDEKVSKIEKIAE